MLGPEMMYFNVDDGYAEALVRALRKGFLKEETYNQLKACSNLSEFKLVLEDTDYSYHVGLEPNPLEIVNLKKRCK